MHSENPGGTALPARLAMSEMTGSDMLLHCESPAGRLTVTSARRDVSENADSFWISCDLDRTLFFDSHSGNRVDIDKSGRTVAAI